MPGRLEFDRIRYIQPRAHAFPITSAHQGTDAISLFPRWQSRHDPRGIRVNTKRELEFRS
jgi:hypothetical protein